MAPSRERLLAELFSGQPNDMAAPLQGWLESRRFRLFVEGHLPKVRKKLRAASDHETARDLLLELETAFRLVSDKRLSVVYEPTPGGTARGPDFAVRYTTKLEVMIEVTRVRSPGATSETAPSRTISRRPMRLDPQRLSHVLGLKLGQISVGGTNVLLIGTDEAPPTEREIDDQMKAHRRAVESTSGQAPIRGEFKSIRDYLKRFSALSAVVVKPSPVLADASPAIENPASYLAAGRARPATTYWLNPAARTPLANDVREALIGALTD